ncbi:MAG TPA: hypothetical protein VLL72_02800, partial [Kiloniellales bacterium]|nr:hypothetical protein [Kiloniellales bacterium]
RREGCAPERVGRPLWQVSTESVNNLSADVVVVPHRQRFQFGPLDCRTWFYMQTTCPWLFTLDPLGWGPASAGYPCGDLDGAEGDAQVFERMAERVIGSNGSKLAQPASRSRAELVARGQIPEGPYVFFACQRPNDQAIRFFSPHEPADVVGALARWSDARGLPVVFKAHPSSPKRAAPLRAATRGLAVRWSEASVHDLIAHSAAVYVINSGVGFEALLHGKPVVTFGRAEYDAVTIHGDPDDLDAAWRRVEAWDPEARLSAYRRFVAWYCRERCVDLSEPAAAQARLSALARAIVGGDQAVG